MNAQLKTTPPASPVIRETLHTADGCERMLTYVVADGAVYRTHDSRWSPNEPELQTTRALLDIDWGNGRREEITLDGDQHRDIESEGRFDEVLCAIAQGSDPADAVADALRAIEFRTACG